jgi:hypothetical protein
LLQATALPLIPAATTPLPPHTVLKDLLDALH